MKRSCDCLNNIVFCSNRDQQFYQSDRQQGTSGFTESSNTSWTTGHFFTETKPTSRSLQQPFHCNSPFIAATVSLARRSQLSFHREDGAATLSCTQRRTLTLETKPSFHCSHLFIGKTELAALSLQPSFHWEDGAGRSFMLIRSYLPFHRKTNGFVLMNQVIYDRFEDEGTCIIIVTTRAGTSLLLRRRHRHAFITKRAESNVHSGV